MKFQLFTLVLVVACAYGMPPASDVVVVDSPNQAVPRIIIEGQIRRIIQQISERISDAGLDPLVIDNKEFEYASEQLLIEFQAFIRDLSFSGASDIRIHSLDYNLLLNRLRFDISLPQLSLIVGDSGIQGSIADNEIEGQFKGSLIIESIRLSGEVRVNISVTSGISLRSVSLNFRLGGIRSDLSVSALDIDFSESLNSLLNETIPEVLEEYRENINEVLEIIVREVFNRLLQESSAY